MENEIEVRYAPHDIKGQNEQVLWKAGEKIPYWIFSVPDNKYVPNPYYKVFGITEPSTPSQS